MRVIYALARLTVALLAPILTSPVGADFTPVTPPKASPSHQIASFPLVGQTWNLTCEYAAASAATAYFDKQISQGEFVNLIGFNANPNKGFRGSLNGPWGGTWDYGVYARPILSVLLARGFAHSYTFKADPTLLKEAIGADHPVVVWITGTYSPMPRYEEESDGEQYLLVPYEHAVTVFGYSEAGVKIMDPAYPAEYDVSWDTFMTAWSQLDGMALAIAP